MIEDVFTREERNDAARRLVALVLEQPTDWRAASACTTLLGLAAGDWAAAGIGRLRGPSSGSWWPLRRATRNGATSTPAGCC
jgi:hypothetical protein